MDEISCREQNIRANAPTYITAGMIIGAALGATFSIALHENPIVGAIGGALLVGGATAVDQYINYRLDQADGNEQVALNGIRTDMSVDAQLSITERQDIHTALLSAVSSFQNKNQHLLENAEKLSKAENALDTTSLNVEAMTKTYDLYQGVLIKTGLVSEAVPRNNVEEIGKNARIAREDRDNFFLYIQENDTRD